MGFGVRIKKGSGLGFWGVFLSGVCRGPGPKGLGVPNTPRIPGRDPGSLGGVGF